MRTAVLESTGVGYTMEQEVLPDIKAGRLVRVLEDWTPPYPGLCLYYPGPEIYRPESERFSIWPVSFPSARRCNTFVVSSIENRPYFAMKGCEPQTKRVPTRRFWKMAAVTPGRLRSPALRL